MAGAEKQVPEQLDQISKYCDVVKLREKYFLGFLSRKHGIGYDYFLP